MRIEEKLKVAAVIIFILFILLYVFNFSFLVNLIIFLIGIGSLSGLFLEADEADSDKDNPGEQ